MTLNDWANIATIAQGAFVIVSIVFVWYQLRENTRLIKAANSQKFIEVASSFNLQLIQDREMAKLWEQGNEEWPTMDAIDKQRYQQLLTWWLLLHESIYHQWKRKLLAQETYEAWTHDLQVFVAAQNFSLHWDRMKGGFESSFAQHVSQIIVSQAGVDHGCQVD